MVPGAPLTELSRNLQVSDRGRNIQRTVRNRTESVCAGLWAPPGAFWAWFRPASGPIWAPNRRFPAGFLKDVGALVSQPSRAQVCEPGRDVLISKPLRPGGGRTRSPTCRRRCTPCSYHLSHLMLRNNTRGCPLRGVFNFYKGRKSLIFGVWAARGPGRPFQTVGGFAPHLLAAQTPKMTDPRSLTNFKIL